MSSLNILGSPSHGISLEPNHDLSTSCELLSLWVGLPYIILSFLQCALLHPTFAHSKLSKLIRMSLMPINFIWWFTLPFRYCLIPSKSISQSRLVLAMGAFYLSIRTLEWGLATSAYYKRPLKTIDGLQRWEKVKEMDEWSKKIQEDERCDGLKLLSWTILQVSSMRGLQFTWGSAALANTASWFEMLEKLFKLNFPLSLSLAFIISTRDSPLGTPASALISLGMPHFPGLTLIAESIYTAAFGIGLACVLEVRFTLMSLLASLVYQLGIRTHCSRSWLEIFDPITFPPAFNSPHLVSSLAELWAKGWHTLLQRTFLFSGAKPMLWFMKKMGSSTQSQRLAGLWGAFAASAILHEYIILGVPQPQDVRSIFNRFPGSGFYFMAQPIGILIEPYLIPRMPYVLGGGKLWTWTFTILTGYPFRLQYMNNSQLFADVPSISDWSWIYLISPLKL